MKLNRNKKGFSLIELMIVIAIIGILVAVALPQFQGMRDEAKVAKAQQDIDVLIGATVKFNALEDKTLSDLFDLEGKYLVEVPQTDPWDKPYVLDPNAGTIRSFGPDRQGTTGDDIVRSFLPSIVLLNARYIVKDQNDGTILDHNGVEIPNLNGDKITFTFSKALKLWDQSGNQVSGTVQNSDSIKLESYFSFYDGGINEDPITDGWCTFGKNSTIEVGVNSFTVTMFGDVNTPGDINGNIEPNQYKVNIKGVSPDKAGITDTKGELKGECDPAIPAGYLTRIRTH